MTLVATVVNAIAAIAAIGVVDGSSLDEARPAEASQRHRAG